MIASAARVRALMEDASIEMSARDLRGLERARAHLAPGAKVSITWLPNENADQRVAAAIALRELGFEPIPHIAARCLASRAELNDFCAMLSREARVRRVFVIGGDLSAQRGPFASAFDVLRTGAIEAAGVEEVGIALYPEGHPSIGDAQLADAFEAKRDLAAAAGLRLFAITQFCFEASPIIRTLARPRRSGDLPVRIGLAGPASPGALLKYALRCGVGASVKFLTAQGANVARLMTERSPEPIIRDLASHPDIETLKPFALHFFAFGGFERTARWMEAWTAGPWPAQDSFASNDSIAGQGPAVQG